MELAVGAAVGAAVGYAVGYAVGAAVGAAVLHTLVCVQKLFVRSTRVVSMLVTLVSRSAKAAPAHTADPSILLHVSASPRERMRVPVLSSSWTK